MKSKYFLGLIFACFALSPVRAQVSSPLSGDRAAGGANGIRFRQELNTYVWQLGFAHRFDWRDKWQFLLQEQFRSSMLRLGADEDKWKDEQDLTAALHYLLLPHLKLHSRINSIAFLDKQSGFNNDISSLTVGCGLHYTPNRHIDIKGSAGPSWEMRLNQKDAGQSYIVDALADAIDWGGYRNHARVALSMDDYGRRTNHDAKLEYRVGKTFTQVSADSVRFFFNDRRRDNYTSELGDIESLREGYKGFENRLVYGIAPTVNLRLYNAYTLRNVELVAFADGKTQRRRKRHDEIGDHNLVLDWRPPKWYGRMTLSYFSQTQKYDIKRGDEHLPFSPRTAFITPDNESSRLFLGAETAMALGRSDSLFYYSSISRFRYDTPDSNNFDDRDELRINCKFIWAHTFTHGLRCEIQATINLYHLVYIFGERSADNNWNRVIRLRPVLAFTPARDFRWFQSFEVLANYVDYDFEPADLQTKSFVFRKFAYDDSLRIGLSARSTALIDYRLQLEENGELYWAEWKERLLTTRASHWLQVRLAYAHNAALHWSPGYTFYSRDEWRHSHDNGVLRRKKYQSFSSHGPMFAVTYLPSQKFRLTLDAVRRKVMPFQQKKYYINTFDIRVDVLF